MVAKAKSRLKQVKGKCHTRCKNVQASIYALIAWQSMLWSDQQPTNNKPHPPPLIPPANTHTHTYTYTQQQQFGLYYGYLPSNSITLNFTLRLTPNPLMTKSSYAHIVNQFKCLYSSFVICCDGGQTRRLGQTLQL